MSAVPWHRLPGPAHELAEEPTLDDDRLVWVDAARGEVWSRPLADDVAPATLLHRLPAPLSAARPFDGSLVVASRMDVLVLDVVAARLLGRIPRDPDRWQVNGLVVLADGSILAGLLSRDRSENGELIQLRGDRTRTVASNVRAANGLCLDDTGQGGWHVDTYARTLTRFALRDGRFDASVISPFAGLPGAPDGICADRDGTVWAAMWDGGLVVRLDDAGAVTARLDLPVARPTCPLVVGDRLYVTTARCGGVAGGLYRTTLTHTEEAP